MNDPRNPKSLDELINQTIGDKALDFDCDNWKQQHPEEIRQFIAKTQILTTQNRSAIEIWRTITKSRITKLATAAVITIAVVIGLNQFGSPFESVSWAAVARNINAIQTFKCQGKTDTKGMGILGHPEQSSMIVYNSSHLGRRVDTYTDKEKLLKREFWNPSKNELILTIPQAKMYSSVTLSEDLFDPTIGQDPYTFIKKFLSFEHVKLGRRKIDGIITEGIEVNDPQLSLNAFESLTGRLWVDVKTNLPVLFEIDGSADVGAMRLTRVFDEFEWNIPLDPTLFVPNIPADYALLANSRISNDSEVMAIEGLHNFAMFADGQYPSSTVLLIAGKETILSWQASIAWERGSAIEQEVQQINSIHSFCFFCARLNKEDRNVAYYGRCVRTTDTDAVLMRWKVSDDEYRVIFGDLSTENVSAERLAELENNSLFTAIMQRPREAAKVQGFIGIRISNWPAIEVIPEMPAEEVGLQSGDVVTAVNGKDVSHILTPNEAMKILRGPAGEVLSITVKRNEHILAFDVERIPLSK
jgi:hypothetical protein